jgi:murein DD-endopeptidase MepM/ murein hydrolase activator NlpD
MSTENKPSRFAALLERAKHISARDVVHRIENGFNSLRSLLEKARETYYRLVVLNNETFEEVGSYKLSIFNFYVAMSALFVGFTMLGMLLIAFTPMKKLIPGYGGYGSERAVFNLYDKIENLEQKQAANEIYIKNLSKRLIGSIETEKDVPKPTASTVPDSNINTTPSAEELQIRASGGGDIFTADNNKDAKPDIEGKAIRVSGRNDRLESMFLQSPVGGEVILGFSLEKKHFGVDISAQKNTAIKAIADGFIIASDWTLETGNTITVQHANNVVSFYKHNSSLLKKTGDKVKVGEAIAIIGNTGEHSSGPHLHFELWKDGKAVNPQEYIRF